MEKSKTIFGEAESIVEATKNPLIARRVNELSATKKVNASNYKLNRKHVVRNKNALPHNKSNPLEKQ